MARKPPQVYDVRSQLTGAAVVIGVPLGLARSECARLDAEAKQPNPERRSSRWPGGEPVGMHCGVVTSYEVVSKAGVVVS